MHARLIVTTVLALSCSLPAFAFEAYYGEELGRGTEAPRGAELRTLLFEVLALVHVVRDGLPDEIRKNCPAGAECFEQESPGYDEARRRLFGQLFLLENSGRYALPDVYCDTTIAESEFPKGKKPGPGRIPDPRIVNAEHAWPQSRFSRKFPRHLQKSDLHILFPVNARVNTLRSNHLYGDVIAVERQICPASALGHTSRPVEGPRFLPPENIRGDVARAVFYFAVRFKMQIAAAEEESLMAWHRRDGVDAGERSRNDQIFAIAKIRNPFVDHPEWVERIGDF
jgi:deoxyribonuclease I